MEYFNGTTTLNAVKQVVDDYLVTGTNDSNLSYSGSTGSSITFRNSYIGEQSSPYAGRVQLSIDHAIPYAKELLHWLSVSYDFQYLSDDLPHLIHFFAVLIGHDDVADCLFGLVRQLRGTSNWALTSLIMEINQFVQIQEQTQDQQLNALVGRLSKIGVQATKLRDTPLRKLSVENIVDDLRSLERVTTGFQMTRQKKDQTPEERESPPIFVDLTTSIPDSSLMVIANLMKRMVVEPRLSATLRIRMRGYLWNFVHHDNHTYLLFGRNAEKIIPIEWLIASWPFINRVRCNFGCLVTEAMLYQTILIVGSRDIEVPVTEDEERFLRDYLPHPDHTITRYTIDGEVKETRSFRIERLMANSPEELLQLLQEMVI